MELSTLCWALSANPISLSPFFLSPLPMAAQPPGPALPGLLSSPSREEECSLEASFQVPWAAHKMMLKSLCQSHSMGSGCALSSYCGVQIWCGALLLPLDLILLAGLWKGLCFLCAIFFLIKVALSKTLPVTCSWAGTGNSLLPFFWQEEKRQKPETNVSGGVCVRGKSSLSLFPSHYSILDLVQRLSKPGSGAVMEGPVPHSRQRCLISVPGPRK